MEVFWGSFCPILGTVMLSVSLYSESTKKLRDFYVYRLCLEADSCCVAQPAKNMRYSHFYCPGLRTVCVYHHSQADPPLCLTFLDA